MVNKSIKLEDAYQKKTKEYKVRSYYLPRYNLFDSNAFEVTDMRD